MATERRAVQDARPGQGGRVERPDMRAAWALDLPPTAGSAARMLPTHIATGRSSGRAKPRRRASKRQRPSRTCAQAGSCWLHHDLERQSQRVQEPAIQLGEIADPPELGYVDAFHVAHERSSEVLGACRARNGQDERPRENGVNQSSP